MLGCGKEPRADFVIHNGPEVETIEPQILTGQGDGRVAACLFEGLTRFHPSTGRAIAGLAHFPPEISPDGKIYTFHIRTNAAWSTGERITADDFVWSWNRAVAPETAADYAGFFFYVKNGKTIVTATNRVNLPPLGVQALDPMTLRVELENPTPFFPELCAMRIMSVVPRRAIERWGNQWIRMNPVPCSGAYSLEYWHPQDRIRLRKNPFYWDAQNVDLGMVDILPGDSAATALNLFLTGGCDYIFDKNMIPTELNDVLKTRKEFLSFGYLGAYFIRFNCLKKPFDDPRVRRAITLVVDRRRIVERITRLGENPASSLVPPGLSDYRSPAGLGQNALEALELEGAGVGREKRYREEMEKNASQARQLLQDAGFGGGHGFPPFAYMFNAGGGGGAKMHEQIGVEIQTMLREHLQLRMELKPVEWKTYLTEMSQLNYDMIRGSWVGDYADPTTFLDCFLSDSGNNRTGWKNPQYDHLLESAAAMADVQQRALLLNQAEKILVADEVPIIPLYHYQGMMAFNPDLFEGIYPNPIDEHPLWAIRRRKLRADLRSN
jgi:oligopeptide transport system substrate-binding protein